jgi:hypothetical protein
MRGIGASVTVPLTVGKSQSGLVQRGGDTGRVDDSPADGQKGVSRGGLGPTH